MIDAFLAYLWRGGAWAVFQRPVGQETFPWLTEPTFESLWFPTTRPAPVPASWGRSDVYFSLHPGAREDRGRFKGMRLEDVTACNCLYAEFDAKDWGGKPPILERLDALWAGGLPYPSVVVDSGGGYHCYWLIEHTVSVTPATVERVRWVQAQWVGLWKGDPSATDLRRTLRVPGTINHKPGRNLAIVAICRELSRLDRLYAWDALAACVPELPQRREVTPAQPPYVGAGNSFANNRRRLYVEASIRGVLDDLAHAGEGERNHKAFLAGRRMAELMRGAL